MWAHRQAVQLLLLDVLPEILRMLPVELQAAFRVHLVGATALPADLDNLPNGLSKHVVHHGWMSTLQLKQLYSQVRGTFQPAR